MRLEHPIFHSPIEPDLDLTLLDVPADYRHGGDPLPAKLLGWKVHDGEFPEVDVGMVSDPIGFEDSPDAEWISSGLNSKGPRSVALGRQGNLFSWGFYGAPDRMTHGAKAVFLNTICYMKQFEGQTALVEKERPARDWVFRYLGYLRELGSRKDIDTSWITGFFPKDVIDAYSDAEQIEQYYRENVEYLYHDGQNLVVDEDLCIVGVSNRRPEFLSTMLARLVLDPKDERALTLIDRYVGGDAAADAESFAEWVRDNGPWLFFSDVGGFRWRTDVHARARACPAKVATAEPAPFKGS